MNAIELAQRLESIRTPGHELLVLESARLLREMHEALEPFAKYSPVVDVNGWPDDATVYVVNGASVLVKMSLGDLRRARKAYEAKP